MKEPKRKCARCGREIHSAYYLVARRRQAIAEKYGAEDALCLECLAAEGIGLDDFAFLRIGDAELVPELASSLVVGVVRAYQLISEMVVSELETSGELIPNPDSVMYLRWRIRFSWEEPSDGRGA